MYHYTVIYLSSERTVRKIMVKVNLTIDIAASPEAVFDFVADPNNHPEFMPSLEAVSTVSDNEVGKQGSYTFNMMGAKLDGSFTDTVFERPTERTYELDGDINGPVTWGIKETKSGSRLGYKASLTFPGPTLLGTLTDPFTRRLLQKEIESTLENVKTLVEAAKVEA